MDFNTYQKNAKKTKIYPKIAREYIYPTLGLVGEAGEFADKIKKVFRDRKGKISKDYKEELKKELGDILWNLSQCATELNLSLDDIAKTNIEKLKSRFIRGKVMGEGDNR